MEGLLAVIQPFTIVLIAIGVVVGIIFGSIPGLTATMAIVMFLLTHLLHDSFTRYLYADGPVHRRYLRRLDFCYPAEHPGTPSSVATVFDGGPMAKKGQAGKALGTGVVFSFFGTIIGIALLVVLTPILCDVALMFQAYEYCALAVFSLSMVIALTGHDMPKGLISAVLGPCWPPSGWPPSTPVPASPLASFR